MQYGGGRTEACKAASVSLGVGSRLHSLILQAEEDQKDCARSGLCT